MINDVELVRCHKHCTNNRGALAVSERAWCFYCEQEFSPAAVCEYVDEHPVAGADGDDGVTALCPLCGVDAVLPSASVRVSVDLLAAMRRRWFGEYA